MAEQQQKGFMQLLTSRDIPWTSRVKFVRYAWTNDSAVIPNKRPFLLNLITTGLVNRKKDLPADENNSLWRCSRDILQAACQLSLVHTSSDVYSLKTGFVQLVLNELQHLASSACVDSEHCAIVVSCCHALTNSPILGLDLTSKFDNMLKLFTSTLQLLMRAYEGELSSIRDPLESLLLVSTPQYTACQRQKSSTSQQLALSICSKLLELYVRFSYYVNCCPSLQLNSNVRSCQRDLEESLISAVFSKDLSYHYGAFLQRKVGKVETGWKESRYIHVLMEALTSAFTNEDTRPAVVQGISWLYATFTDCYKESNSELPLLFLRYLCEAFCFDSNISADAEKDGSVESKAQFGNAFMCERMEVLHLLLRTTMTSNIFDVVHDRSDDNKTMHWFQAVAAWLLLQKSRCKDWFHCLRDLLLLSPSTLETRLVGLVNSVWTIDPDTLTVETKQAQCDLFVEMVHTYTRMRQVGRLMHAMLLAIRNAKECVYMHGNFVDSLQLCFADLDAMTVIDIWHEFNTELSTQYQESPNNDLGLSRVKAVCELLNTLILNVTAVGHSISKVAESKLGTLLQTTRLYVLSQLDKTCLKKKTADGASCLMKLLHACGSLLMVKQAYGISDYQREMDDSNPTSRTFHDLSLLHPAWEGKNWSKFHRFVTASGNMQLLLCWVKLILQGIQYDRCCHKAVSQQLLQEVNDFVLIADCWDISKTAANQASVVNDLALHWSTILENVTLLIPADITPSVPVEAIARFLFYALTSSSAEVDGSSPWRDVATAFVSTPTFLEMQSLHACLVTSVIGHILHCLGDVDAPKSKRRRHSREHECLIQVLKLIGDLNIHLVSNEDGSVVIPPELVSLMNEVLDQKDIANSVNLSDETAGQLITALKVLKVLPLEYLDIAGQVKCILSMLVLAAMSNVHTVAEGTHSIQGEALRVLQCMLFEGQGIHSLMNSLGPGSVMQWFLGLRLRLTVQNTDSVDLLKTCDDVLRRLVRLSTKHSTMISHLTDLVHSIKQQLRENRKSSNDQQIMKFSFRAMSMVLEVVTKVLRRPYIRPENRAAFHSVNDSIMQELSKCLTGLNDEPVGMPSTETCHNTMSSWVLLGYSCQLAYASLQSNTDSEENAAKVRHKVLKFLPSMCGKCLTNLQQMQNVDTVTSCARLVVVICSCYSSLRDRLPDNFLNDVWPLVVNQLRTFDPSPSQSIGSDSKQYLHDNNERTYLETTLAGIVTVSDSSFIRQRLDELQADMESGELGRIIAAVRIYSRLIQTIALFPNDVIKAILPSCLKVLLIVQRLQMVSATDKNVVVAILHMKTAMLSASWLDGDHTKSVITANILSLCLHPCAAIELRWTSEDMNTFFTICRSWHELLNAVLIYHSAIVYRMVPAYIAGVRQLLKAIMQAGTQHVDQNQRYTDRQLDEITDCARLFDRLASLICSHKVNFAKSAPYLIADYANEAQKVTLYPVVKRTLLLAVYKLLDRCGEHTTRQLNTVLPSGAREVFRIIYANFDKYYRYSRRTASEDRRNVEFIQTVYNG